MAKPNEPAAKPEQTSIPAPKRAPVHHAIHCREADSGEFIVVDVAYSTDAPAKETELFRHASSAIAIGAMQREVNMVKASLIHPSRFATREAVATSST
jgi:hypothetical protein